MNLRPSGYEPDELPGCSTPRRWGKTPPPFARAAGADREEASLCGRSPGLSRSGRRAWRRPTLPRLVTQYHGRWGVSRPSSGWGRVGHPRHGRQAVRADRAAKGPSSCSSARFWAWGRRSNRSRFFASSPWPAPFWGRPLGEGGERCRAIRTGQLRALPRVHTRPIDVVVFHGPDRETSFCGGFPA